MASQGLVWALLLPFSYAYGMLSRLSRLGSGQRVTGLRVVSVGNLSVGGAGKTPLAMAIAAHYLSRGKHPAILTRGYGGDEPQMLRQELPGVRVFVGADRLALAQQARAAGCDRAVLDDGFQRRHQLARDLDILVVDWSRRHSDRYCLPAGRLREPLSAAKEAQVVVVTHAPEDWNEAALRSGLPAAYQGLTVLRGDHRPLRLRPLKGGASLSLSWLKNRAVTALSGIGNPAAFEEQLVRSGAVVEARRFADHHPFSSSDLRGIAGPIVCTAKDAVKLAGLDLPEGATVLVLEMELRISSKRLFEGLLP